MYNAILDNILPIIVGAVATPLGAWIGMILQRKKYDMEINKLKADIDLKLSEVGKSELENVRMANDILLETVVAPLKKEIKTLRNGLNRLNKALEKIPSCAYADHCPISRELRNQEITAED